MDSYRTKFLSLTKIGITCGFLFFLLISSVPPLLSSGAINAGMLILLKGWSPCPEDDIACVTYPTILADTDSGVADRALVWFDLAKNLRPASRIAGLHLAEISFAQGQRQVLLDLVSPIEQIPPARSPLVAVGSRRERYEAYLVHALQKTIQGDLSSALFAYQSALSFGAEYLQAEDLKNYHLVLARVHQQQAEVGQQVAQNATLAGKYYLEADDFDEAFHWLHVAITNTEAGTQELRAYAYLQLARLHERTGNYPKALAYLEVASQLSPTARLVRLARLRLLLATGQLAQAALVESELAALGPQYLLGRQAQGYLLKESTALPSGEFLVGYDLDQASLESDRNIELWLWWQNLSFVPEESGKWTRAGVYWIEKRLVLNLFTNAGFEWGIESTGIPLGHDRRLYGSTTESLQVIEVLRAGTPTSVLAALNNDQNPSVALASYPIAADPEKIYLMAGWLWDTTRVANIGRNCWWEGGGAPFYIAYEKQTPYRPTETWVHVADLDVLFPDQAPERGCEVLLIHYMTGGRAMWDDILWVEIDLPSPGVTR